MGIRIKILITALLITAMHGYSQENIKSDSSGDHKKIVLDLQGIIQGVLQRNPDTQKAFIDYSGADTDMQKFLGQYDIYAYGKVFNKYRQLSKDNPAISIDGYQAGQTGVETGIQKYFNTGTTINAGVTTLHQKITSPVAGIGMAEFKGYSSMVNVGLSQELLKNAFGSNDRLTGKSLQKVSEIKQRAARQAVSEILMGAFVAYWNYIIADQNYKTAQIAFKNTQDIRNLVHRKSQAGISEKEELFDWEGRVLQAKNFVDEAEVALVHSRLAILRALDFDNKSEIEIRQNLSTDDFNESFESALETAMRKRADLQNMKAYLDVSEMNLAVAKGNALPSLKASVGMGYNDYDTSRFMQSFNTYNRQWNMELMVSTPLESSYDNANIREAKNNVSKNRILLKQLKNGIRDEIYVRIKKCSAAYKVYRQTSQSSEYARAYYEQVYRRFSQGRYESAQMKLAFDNYIMLKNSALKSLVDYNVSLLELDIAKNNVFDKYSIDIDKLLSRHVKKE